MHRSHKSKQDTDMGNRCLQLHRCIIAVQSDLINPADVQDLQAYLSFQMQASPQCPLGCVTLCDAENPMPSGCHSAQPSATEKHTVGYRKGRSNSLPA